MTMGTLKTTSRTRHGTSVLSVELGKNPAGEMQYQNLAVDGGGNLCHLPDEQPLPDVTWRWASKGDIDRAVAASQPEGKA
jgi:hypothetical protein